MEVWRTYLQTPARPENAQIVESWDGDRPADKKLTL